MDIRKLVTLAVAITTAAQAAVTINFENDPVGSQPNGFSSVDSPLVTFSNLAPSDGLSIFDSLTPETMGNSLFVEPESTQVILSMDFSVPIYSLSLMFGNDDPSLLVALPGIEDLAVLYLYDGTTLLDTVTMIPNGNDEMDETIAWIHSGTPANRAEFFYGDFSQNPIDLIETVDNITFETTVPEPSTYAALGFASVVGAFAWRRRRKKA